MSITCFGFIYLLIYFIIFLKNNKNKIKLFQKSFIFSMFSLLLFDVGFLMKIGDFVVEYNYFSSIFTFLLAIIVFIKHKIPLKTLLYYIIFILFLLVGILVPLIVNIGYEGVGFKDEWDSYFASNLSLPTVYITWHSFFLLFRTMIFFFDFIVFVTVSRWSIFETILKTSQRISILILLVSFVEILIINLFDGVSYRVFLLDFFGHSEATYVLHRTFFGFKIPMLFEREPSKYSTLLFIFSIANIAYIMFDKNNLKNVRKSFIVIFLNSILMMLSYSLSSIIYLIIIIILIFYCFVKMKHLLMALILSVCIIIVTFFFMKDRLDYVFNIFSMLNEEPRNLPLRSEVTRLYSIFHNFKLFLRYPILGCGLGSVYSYSSLITMLSNIGIVGIVLYVILINKLTNDFFKVKKISFLLTGTFILTYLFTGHLSEILYLEKIVLFLLFVKYINLKKRRVVNDA